MGSTSLKTACSVYTIQSQTGKNGAKAGNINTAKSARTDLETVPYHSRNLEKEVPNIIVNVPTPIDAATGDKKGRKSSHNKVASKSQSRSRYLPTVGEENNTSSLPPVIEISSSSKDYLGDSDTNSPHFSDFSRCDDIRVVEKAAGVVSSSIPYTVPMSTGDSGKKRSLQQSQSHQRHLSIDYTMHRTVSNTSSLSSVPPPPHFNSLMDEKSSQGLDDSFSIITSHQNKRTHGTIHNERNLSKGSEPNSLPSVCENNLQQTRDVLRHGHKKRRISCESGHSNNGREVEAGKVETNLFDTTFDYSSLNEHHQGKLNHHRRVSRISNDEHPLSRHDQPTHLSYQNRTKSKQISNHTKNLTITSPNNLTSQEEETPPTDNIENVRQDYTMWFQSGNSHSPKENNCTTNRHDWFDCNSFEETPLPHQQQTSTFSSAHQSPSSPFGTSNSGSSKSPRFDPFSPQVLSLDLPSSSNLHNKCFTPLPHGNSEKRSDGCIRTTHSPTSNHSIHNSPSSQCSFALLNDINTPQLSWENNTDSWCEDDKQNEENNTKYSEDCAAVNPTSSHIHQLLLTDNYRVSSSSIGKDKITYNHQNSMSPTKQEFPEFIHPQHRPPQKEDHLSLENKYVRDNTSLGGHCHHTREIKHDHGHHEGRIVGDGRNGGATHSFNRRGAAGSHPEQSRPNYYFSSDNILPKHEVTTVASNRSSLTKYNLPPPSPMGNPSAATTSTITRNSKGGASHHYPVANQRHDNHNGALAAPAHNNHAPHSSQMIFRGNPQYCHDPALNNRRIRPNPNPNHMNGNHFPPASGGRPPPNHYNFPQPQQPHPQHQQQQQQQQRWHSSNFHPQEGPGILVGCRGGGHHHPLYHSHPPHHLPNNHIHRQPPLEDFINHNMNKNHSSQIHSAHTLPAPNSKDCNVMTSRNNRHLHAGSAHNSTRSRTLDHLHTKSNNHTTTCIPLKAPIPSSFQGDFERMTNFPIPDFASLVNFPSYMTTGKSSTKDRKKAKSTPCHQDGEEGCASGTARRCVMCGLSRASSKRSTAKNIARSQTASTASNSSSYTATEHAIIPIQNKGLCTMCDVNVWVIVQTGLEIKWCKGCKNFKTWAGFGQKGLATKCVRCRDRQREKYALIKEEKEKMKTNVDVCDTVQSQGCGEGL